MTQTTDRYQRILGTLTNVRQSKAGHHSFDCPLDHKKAHPPAEIWLDAEGKIAVVCYDCGRNSMLFDMVVAPHLPGSRACDRPARPVAPKPKAKAKATTTTWRWLKPQMLPVADAPTHPIRQWCGRRHLWREDLPLPPSFRWVPFDAPVFRGTHTGIGAIAVPLAPIKAWRDAYPDTPNPTAVQLICIDTSGEKATYTNSQGRSVDKPKFGRAHLAVWTIGDVRNDGLVACEGVADALALGAREPETVMAFTTTPRKTLEWRGELDGFNNLTFWPDMDEADEQGRRVGLDDVMRLGAALRMAGRNVEVKGVAGTQLKDPADAAQGTVLKTIDVNEVCRWAAELVEEGYTPFEAMRYAASVVQ